MNKLIQRFILWYMMRGHILFRVNGKTVRVFSDDWYEEYVAPIRSIKK